MCLLRKYGLTILPIFRHFFHFPKQRLFYPHQNLHPLRGHKKRALQISRHFLGKDDDVDWRLLNGLCNGPEYEIPWSKWRTLIGLVAWRLACGAKVRRLGQFFLLKKYFCTAFFPIYSKIARELQEAVNLEMSASVLFTANPPYGSDWLIQGNFALRWTQLRCLHEVVN